MNRTTKRIGALGTATVAVMGAGVAFAAWTTNGTGTGTASAGSATALSITSTAVTGLYPTASKTVEVTVSNTNPYRVQLSNLRLTSVDVASRPNDDPTTPTCTNANIASVITSSGLALGNATNDVVAASTGTATTKVYSTFPLSVSNDLPNGCQGASFTLNFAVDGVSAPPAA